MLDADGQTKIALALAGEIQQTITADAEITGRGTAFYSSSSRPTPLFLFSPFFPLFLPPSLL